MTQSPSTGATDVFISGEVVDLCTPTDDPAVLDVWYRWFNRPSVTKYLAQGGLPNTVEAQRQFLSSSVSAGDRLIVLIRAKALNRFVGVASLSMINHDQRQCDFAMVIGEQTGEADSLFYALETKCRLTEHAFDTLGLERINSTQVVDLVRWQRWQILLGYQIEGILRKRFRKGQKSYDVMASSCLVEDYLTIKEVRRGQFWPGKAKMFELIKRLPKQTLLDELLIWLPEHQREFMKATTFATED